jgi:hypothetical protein
VSADVLTPHVRGSLEAAQNTALELSTRLQRDLAVHVEQLRREYGDEAVERYLHSMGGQRLLDDVTRSLRCLYVPPQASPNAPDVLRSEGGGALYEWEAEVEQLALEHAAAVFMCADERRAS